MAQTLVGLPEIGALYGLPQRKQDRPGPLERSGQGTGDGPLATLLQEGAAGNLRRSDQIVRATWAADPLPGRTVQ